jgi:glycosyltransferase involved in cell wall biosynthesis
MSGSKISVVISARNESPQIVWTIYSIIQDLETTGKKWEIILVDNGSNDDTSDYLRTRGMVGSGKVRILFDPVMGNVSARNKGVEISE